MPDSLVAAPVVVIVNEARDSAPQSGHAILRIQVYVFPLDGPPLGKRSLLRLAIRKNIDTFAGTKNQGKWKQSTISHLNRYSSPAAPWIMQPRCVSTTSMVEAAQ